MPVLRRFAPSQETIECGEALLKDSVGLDFGCIHGWSVFLAFSILI